MDMSIRDVEPFLGLAKICLQRFLTPLQNSVNYKLIKYFKQIVFCVKM